MQIEGLVPGKKSVSSTGQPTTRITHLYGQTMNLTEERSQVNETSEEITAADVALSVTTILLSLLICAGNALTIAAIIRSPRLHTLPNMYVMSLAAADLLVGLLMPVLALFFLAPIKNAFNNAKYACLLLFAGLYASCLCSAINMALIATDRYIFITRPFWYERVVTHDVVRGVVAVCWSLAVLMGSVPLYANRFKYDSECDSTKVLLFSFDGIFLPVFFFSCAMLTAVLYTLVIRLAKAKQKVGPSPSVSDSPFHPRPASSGALHSTRGFTRRQYRAVILFISVFGIFLCCWSPRVIATIVNHYITVSDDAYNVLTLLGLLNSGMNFFVYGFCNKDFRQAFTTMFRARGQDNLPPVS